MAVQIPVYRQQTMVGGGLPTPRARGLPVVSAFGEAAPSIAHGLDSLAQAEITKEKALRQREEESAKVEAMSVAAKGRLEMLQAFEEAKANADLEAKDFVPNFLKQFDEYQGKALENVSPLARKYAEEKFREIRTRLGEDAIVFQAASNVAFQESRVENAIADRAKVARMDPTQFQDVVTEQINEIGALGISPQKRLALNQKAKREIAYYAALGQIEQDPQGFITKVTTQGDDVAFNMLDAKDRESLVDHAYSRMDSERARMDREVEKWKRERGDEFLKEAYTRLSDGTLDRQYVDQIKPFISPAEHKSLLEGLKGDVTKDDPAVFGRLQSLMYTDPAEAERAAFLAHSRKQITNSTLSSILDSARTIARQEGPKSDFERYRSFISTSLDPGEFSADPAPRARQGLALREYDDFASSEKRTEKDLREAADRIVRKYALIDMNDLAVKTSIGARDNPERTLQEIAEQGRKLERQRQEGSITEAEYQKRIGELNELRKSAQKASNGN